MSGGDMKLRVKPISLEVGRKPVVILNKQDAESLGLHALDRVRLKFKGKELITILDISTKFVEPGEISTNTEVTSFFHLKLGDVVEIKPERKPESISFIKQKIAGSRLRYDKIKAIVEDVVEKHLSDIELSAFVTALETQGLSMDEVESLSKAMIETGKRLKITGTVCDKHSIGGIPGDKTSLLLVPIIAAAGLKIPKTSSRAITSPAGSADRMEVLAPVDLKKEEIEKIVKKVNGCLVWGGALDLAPADDAFIKIEYPLGIDPLLLPSIISKKKAVNAKHVVIDIPTGRGSKIKTIGSAQELSEDFIELGKRLNMNINCAITFGEQPLGYAIGPALEAKEALVTILNHKGSKDLIEKVTNIAGILLSMTGKGNQKTALRILKTKAKNKFKEIIEAQGGNPKIKPNELPLGSKTARVRSNSSGRVLWVKNPEIASIARETGAPRDKGAGIFLSKKIGDKVNKGELLFTIYAEKSLKLENALNLVEEYNPIGIGKYLGERMLLRTVPTKRPHRRIFMLER